MTRSKWKLTRRADVEEWGEERLRFGSRRLSVLALLAEDPRNQFVEVRPGVYLGPKAP